MTAQRKLIEVARHDAPVPPLAAYLVIAYWPGSSAHWKIDHLCGLGTADDAARATVRLGEAGYRHITVYRVEHEGK